MLRPSPHRTGLADFPHPARQRKGLRTRATRPGFWAESFSISKHRSRSPDRLFSPWAPWLQRPLPSFFATTSPSDFSPSVGAFSGLPSSAPTNLVGDVEISQVPRLILGSVLPALIPAGTMHPRLYGCTATAFDDYYRLGSRDKQVSRLDPFTCVAARYLAVYASPRRSPDAAQDSLRPCSAKLWAEGFSWLLSSGSARLFLALNNSG